MPSPLAQELSPDSAGRRCAGVESPMYHGSGAGLAHTNQENQMNQTLLITASALLIVSGLALSQSNPRMSFFITSSGSGNGAALGGLAGADKHCQMLAQAVGAGNKTWHAYLSAAAADGQPTVNARDRIGNGPWYNAQVAMGA